MGRKRTNELKAGGKTTLYVPQDIDPKVLEFLNEQKNLSKTVIELSYMYVYQISAQNFSMIGRLGVGLLKQQQDMNEPGRDSKKDRKTEALRSMLDTDRLG